MQHIAIRRESYVAGTSERPEVGVFTQTHGTRHPVPWGRLAVGDLVWMKWSGGPIVATAHVSGFRQFEFCNAQMLRESVHGFGLYELSDYWESLPPAFSAITIYLENERWLDHLIEPASRSRGESWIVLSTPESEASWLTPDGVLSAARRTTPAVTRRSRTLSASLRFSVFRRDNFACRYCGAHGQDVRLHVDHVEAWSKGGSNTLDNLVTACSTCNLGKGATQL